MTAPERPGASEHGDVFGRGWGNMFIHVQRASGLAHRTLVLRPWQVQALRLLVSKWFALVITGVILSWLYFAVQTARLPFLTRRIAHLEQDAAKLDTLQMTLEQLQRRYDQVQQMLSASSRAPGAGAAAAEGSVAAGNSPSSGTRSSGSAGSAHPLETMSAKPAPKAPAKDRPNTPPFSGEFDLEF